jgi:hypothetical protein
MPPQKLTRSSLKCVLSLCGGKEVSLDLVVEDEHEGTTRSSDDVGEGTLEKGLRALVLKDLGEAVHCASVLNVTTLLARLHHQASSDGIKRVRYDTGGNGHELGETPNSEEVGLLDIFEKEGFA